MEQRLTLIETENHRLHEVEELLTRKSAFQSLLMKISNDYINIPLEHSNDAINNSLKEIGLFVDADRSYIFDYDHEGKTASNTFEFCSEGIQPEIQNLQQIPYDMIPDWIEYHFAGKMIYIPEVNKLPEGNLKELLASQNIQSLITLPMMSGETCLGFIGFDAVRTTRLYTNEEIDLLKLYSQMLINLKLRTKKENDLNEIKSRLEKSLEQEIELNQMKSNFITMTSHQFRSPLTTIQASADLLNLMLNSSNEKGKEKMQKHIGRIFTEVGRLNSLLSEVRFLGRASNEKINLKPTMVDLSVLFNNLINEVDLYPGDSRKPKLLLNGIPRAIHADEQLLSQAFNCLLNNALKFSQGCAEPEVTIYFQSEKIEVVIMDYGIGIPQPHMENLFKSFARASNAENINGTGLGLAIAKHIFDLHHAEIQVTSVIGNGSQFKVIFNQGNKD